MVLDPTGEGTIGTGFHGFHSFIRSNSQPASARGRRTKPIWIGTRIATTADMPRGKLTVMKQPGKTAAVLKLTDKSKTVLIKGGGDFDYLCGECETILMEGVQQDKCLGLVLLCNKCGSFNAALLRSNGPQ